jgi:hypothetical protein
MSYSETDRRRLAKGIPLRGRHAPGGDDRDAPTPKPAPEKKFYHEVPFSQKDDAKKEGMRWDPEKKKWYHSGPYTSASSKFKKLTEEAVQPKNHSYGWIGTHKVSEKNHAEATKKWAPHVIKHLTDALKKHQAGDKHFEKVTGTTTTSAKVRAGIKVDHKMAAHFLDSTHGRHLAHHSVEGKEPTDPKVATELKQRASEFTRSYHPSHFEESTEVDQMSGIITEALEESLSDKVLSVYKKYGTKNDGSHDSKEWHAAWMNATQGETPSQARARRAALEKLDAKKLKEDVSTKRADRKAVTTTKPDGTRETKWARTSHRDIVKEAMQLIAEEKLVTEEYNSHDEATAALERHKKKFPSANLSITKGVSGKYHVMKHTSGGSSRVTG